MTSIAHYAAYDSEGRISLTVSGPLETGPLTMQINGKTEYVRLETPASPDEYYLPQGNLTLRPDSTVVLDGNLLRGVPAGAQVTIEGQVYIADGTDIHLEFEHSGTYTLTVDAFPQKPWVGEYLEN